MASNNIARLGVILGIDTAEFQKGIDDAVKKEKEFARIIRADSNAAAKEIASLKYATDNYNKSLTKTEEIQYRISQGDLAKAEQPLLRLLPKSKIWHRWHRQMKLAASAPKSPTKQKPAGHLPVQPRLLEVIQQKYRLLVSWMSPFINSRWIKSPSPERHLPGTFLASAILERLHIQPNTTTILHRPIPLDEEHSVGFVRHSLITQ